MKDIIAINNILSAEEKREFVLFLKKKNRRGDAKNIDLYKYIDIGKTDELDIRLYGKPARNSYHALCKRLQDNLIDFIAEKSFSSETSEEMQIMKQLLASRIFFEHKLVKPAVKLLDKAERSAIELDLYTILSEIYQTKIQYAHLHPGEDFDDIERKAIRNQQLQERELKLNIAYALIKQKLHSSPENIETLIHNAFESYGITLDEALTYKSLYQLFQILATSAELKSDYASVIPYAKRIYTIVDKKQTQADKHLYYHIAILHLMAVVGFRNKDFESSTYFVSRMEAEMVKQQQTYYRLFRHDLVLLKALNLNYTGNATEALNLLSGIKDPSPQIVLAHVMCLFQQREFIEGWRTVSKLHHSDKFYEKKCGFIWVVQRNIIELLLLIELDRLSLVLSRLKSIERKLFPRLRAMGEERAIAFLKLVKLYYEDPEVVASAKFREKVENAFVWKEARQEDVFVMSFYAWLKSKMEGSDVYEVTLGLVNIQ